MVLSDAQVTGVILFIVLVCGGTLIKVIHWLGRKHLDLHAATLAAALASNKACEDRSAAQQRQIEAQQHQIDALIDGDRETARRHRSTDLYFRPEETAQPSLALDRLPRPPSRVMSLYVALLTSPVITTVLSKAGAGAALIMLIGTLLACGQTQPVPALADVPAQDDADQFEQQYASESTAAIAASTSASETDHAAAAPGLTPDQIAGLRAKADRQRADAERHRALADELRRLRDDARDRAKAERAEVTAQAAAAAQSADDRHARWLAGWAVAGSVVLGGAVLYLTKSVPLGAALPGLVIAGAVTLSAWQIAAPYLAWILAVALLGLVAGAVGILVAVLVTALREWHHSALSPAATDPCTAAALSAQSRARQAPWVRWILDHLLRRHALPASATPEVPHG